MVKSEGERGREGEEERGRKFNSDYVNGSDIGY
jgi:hypothetical protein